MSSPPACPARLAAVLASLIIAELAGCSLSVGGLPSDGDGGVRPDDATGEVRDDGGADAEADTDGERDVGEDAGADADAEVDVEVDAEVDEGPDADADGDVDEGPDADADADIEEEAEEEAEAEAEEEAEAEADGEEDAGEDGGPCLPPETDCGGTCVDTRSDPDHCGGCSAPCDPGWSCERSVCRCPAGTTPCDTECVDTTSSAAHCSGCFLACRAGAVCEGSVCRCAPGTSLCDGGTACTTAPDTDGDGICDAEDPCSMDGPDSRVLPDPASGELVSISGVSLDGGSNVLLGVARGATFTLAYDWAYDDAARSCCACTTYISFGYADRAGPEGCQGRIVSCAAAGSFVTALSAPTEPGTYFIGFRKHWELSCPSAWTAPPPEQQYAAICVW